MQNDVNMYNFFCKLAAFHLKASFKIMCYIHTISLEFQKYEQVYNEQLKKGTVTQKAQFEYAWCLVRSKFSADIRKGIIFLEELYQNGNEEGRRDDLYYLAIGNARIKVGVLMFESVNSVLRFLNFVCSVAILEYSTALHYVRTFLQIEPGNQQVQKLETLIRKKMEKEGLIGMAMAGGVVLAIGGLVGLGLALARK
ncbi:hypothetical protein Cfor_04633 [Coptotermes formosanus]|uniref:Mitochondrial fission 1 protein n=1 Tax=Coptotermes formosanus TaxID=36987 RepID=A0A6L2PR66_COPFO|nr:hypothetical protein Cfor_04633 [Coptotermes formosanus]